MADGRIRVTEAIYGDLSSKDRCIVVTELLNLWLGNYDGYYLRLGPETKNTLPGFKDPAKGRKKQFKITFSIGGGAERTNLYGEYEEVELYAERPPKIEPSIALCQPLVVKGNVALTNALIARWAPEVRLHREELYFPCSIEWYLRLSEVCYDGKQGAEDPRLAHNLTNFGQLFHTLTIGVVRHTSEEPNSDFYVTPLKENKAMAYTGVKDLDTVPVYAHVIQYDDTKEIDIQYYFFYAYNGPIVALLQKAGTHEGDWEHVTMRLAPDGSLRAIFMDTYPKEHKWYMQEASSPRAHDGYMLNAEGHPIVWAAKHSHTSYAWAGLQRRTVGLGIVDEVTDDFGLHWQTWKRVIEIGDPENPINGQTWVRFAGSWGTPPRNKLDYGGKRTPSILHAYRFGDPPPERGCMVPTNGASHRHCGMPTKSLSGAQVRDINRTQSTCWWRRITEAPCVRLLGSGGVAMTAEGAIWARQADDKWQLLTSVTAPLKTLCMRGAELWVLAVDDSASYRTAGQGWTKAPVQLSWLTSGGNGLYGLSASGTEVLALDGQQQWQLIQPSPPVSLMRLTAGHDGALMGLTSDGRAYYRSPGVASVWKQVGNDAVPFASAALLNDVEGLLVAAESKRLYKWNGVTASATEETFTSVAVGLDGSFYATDDVGVLKLCRRSLRLCPVRSFTKICDDKGLDSAPQPVTFFRPAPLAGFYILGDYVEQTQLTQPCWSAAALTVSEETNDDSGVPLLADAVGFDCVWMAVGTRARVPFSLWRPIAPECYAALGYVISGSADAAPQVQVKCVHHSLLSQGMWKSCGPEKYLWSDKRLGAKFAPISLWAVEAHGGDLVAGTFGASSTYDEPSDPPLCLRGSLQ